MPVKNLKNLSNLPKSTLVLGIALILILIGAFFTYSKLIAKPSVDSNTTTEVDLPFDPEGPYALLYPRRDGNALALDLKRTASYDQISYELAYFDGDGINRGVVGTLNTSEKKGEYEQEILFGTCSKNVCKYDKGVENGTLTLHIKKGSQTYRMVSQWHLQKPDVALGMLNSGDGHFTYKIASSSADLSLVQYTIINDLSGAPKLPDNRNVVGKVYSVNPPLAKSLPAGEVTIELSDNPASNSKIAYFDEAADHWVELDSKVDGDKLHAGAPYGGVFIVLAPQK